MTLALVRVDQVHAGSIVAVHTENRPLLVYNLNIDISNNLKQFYNCKIILKSISNLLLTIVDVDLTVSTRPARRTLAVVGLRIDRFATIAGGDLLEQAAVRLLEADSVVLARLRVALEDLLFTLFAFESAEG